MSHAVSKLKKLQEVRRLLLRHPEGLTMDEIARRVEVDRSSVSRYLRHDLDGVVEIAPTLYTIHPTDDDVAIAHLVLARVGLL